ncbi:Endonuclease MUS81 [Phaffia rhodozyma]|uniref:Crossover junction endonuclease MUS81 n=1 Tax=Phaffia rhodozyma TaxID=264483 RepID=A0A0F7SNN0_PHARH|nr:Endonuclease MUS81 [Phaffia rhodozyma]
MPSRPKTVCGNPLFLEWVEEMRGEAEEKGMKSASTYAKAANSLRLCPIKFIHPAQCAQLVGVGPTIIDRLSKKLAAHCKQTGISEPPLPEGLPKTRKKAVPLSQARSPLPEDNHIEFGFPPSQPIASGSGSQSQFLPPSKRKAMTSNIDGSDEDKESSSENGEPAFLRKKDSLRPSALKAKKAKKTATTKMYVPAQGTGPYAILLALVSHTTEQDQDVPVTKQDIIDIATRHSWCLKSFVVPEPGKHHTAWNGIKTLMNHELIYARGQPARWSLTELGYELACQLRASLEGFANSRDRPDRVPYHEHQRQADPLTRTEPPLRNVIPPFDTLSGSVQRSSDKSRFDGVSRTPVTNHQSTSANEKFGFHFLDRGSNRIREIDKARIKVDDSGEQLVRIEFLSSQHQLSFVKASVVDAEDAPSGRDPTNRPTVFGWVPVADVPRIAIGFPDQHLLNGAASSLPATNRTLGLGLPNVLHQPQIIPPQPSNPDVIPLSVTRSQNSRLLRSTSASASIPESAKADSTFNRSVSSGHQTRLLDSSFKTQVLDISISSVGHQTLGPQKSSNLSGPAPLPISGLGRSLIARSNSIQHRLEVPIPLSSVFHESDENRNYSTTPLPTTTTTQTGVGMTSDEPRGGVIAENEMPIDFKTMKPITWEAGSYDILLLLDTREVQSRSERDAFLDKIKLTGVDVQGRALPVGDMVWIAKRRDGFGTGLEEEVVLDFVVERKRLDDLIMSIKDGRFHEQKHRLRNSGIGQVIYLIEDYNVAYQEQVWAPQIATAVSSTQVVEGFFVKRTQSLDATVEYLRCMHDTIKTLHEGANLTIIPDRNISRSTYLSLQSYLRNHSASTPHLISYSAYVDLNSKSNSLTLHELWCRMLLTIQGMSAEKVGAVVEVYRTPMSLWRAFQTAEREEAKLTEATTVSGISLEPGKGKRQQDRVPMAKNLLADTIQGVGRRSIGRALSAKVYELFRMEHY